MNTRTLKFILSIFFLVMAMVAAVYIITCNDPADQSAWIMIMFYCFGLFGCINIVRRMAYIGVIVGTIFAVIFFCQSSGIAHPVHELWQWISQNIS